MLVTGIFDRQWAGEKACRWGKLVVNIDLSSTVQVPVSSVSRGEAIHVDGTYLPWYHYRTPAENGSRSRKG